MGIILILLDVNHVVLDCIYQSIFLTWIGCAACISNTPVCFLLDQIISLLSRFVRAIGNNNCVKGKI